MKSLIAAGLLAALAIAPVASGEAAVIFSVVQNGPTVVGPLGPSDRETAPFTTNLQLTVTDEAAADGFFFNIPLADSPAAPQVDGLLSISLQLVGPGGFTYTLPDFLNRNPGRRYISTLTLTAAAGGLLSGEVYGNSTSSDTRVLLDGTSAVTGFVNSDTMNLVCFVNNCSYTAMQTRTAVPEPMSITLFGAGLVGLAVARRRKA